MKIMDWIKPLNYPTKQNMNLQLYTDIKRINENQGKGEAWSCSNQDDNEWMWLEWESHHFAAMAVIIDYGKNHPWMLRLEVESLMRSRVQTYLQSIFSSIINCKVEKSNLTGRNLQDITLTKWSETMPSVKEAAYAMCLPTGCLEENTVLFVYSNQTYKTQPNHEKKNHYKNACVLPNFNVMEDKYSLRNCSRLKEA